MTAAEIADQVLRSKKYSTIDRGIVERLSTETITKYSKQKDIIKAVKKELHIIHESFLQDECHIKAEAIIDSYDGDDLKTDKDISIQLMELHVSTKERLEQAAEVYGFIGRYVKPEDSVIDTGCGFNPFALPFYSGLPKSYLALDIDISTVKTLNKYFNLSGLPYTAETCDIVLQTPAGNWDILFMFKLFPLLERQKKSRAFEIIKTMDAGISIISFPLKSSSGKEKGMEAFYSSQFENELPLCYFIIEKMKFINEMFYVIGKR